MPGGPFQCINFSMIGPSTNATPFDVLLGTGKVEFKVFDHKGNPWPNDAEIHDRSHAMGLDCGFRLEIRLVNLGPVATVAVNLIHMARPGKVMALESGSVVDAAGMDPNQGMPHLITLGGTDIDQVVITVPANETALLEFCAG